MWLGILKRVGVVFIVCAGAFLAGSFVAGVFESTGYTVNDVTAFVIVVVLNSILSAVNLGIYDIVGRESFCSGEQNILFRWIVRHLGRASFVLWTLTGPVIVAICAQAFDTFFRGAVYGVAMGVLIVCLSNDLRELIKLRRGGSRSI